MRTTGFGLIVALITLIMSAGCSTKAPPRTPGMEAIGVEITTAELRQRLYQFESVFAGAVLQASDAILQTETDRTAQEMAIRWKINVVPTLHAAVFQLDPLAGLADTWALTAQMERFFTSGNGSDLFGDSQQVAVDASRLLHAEVRELAMEVVGPDRVRDFEPRLSAWLDENRIRDISFVRRSVASDAARITAATSSGGGLQSVGNIEEMVRDLSARMTIYTTQLPELGRAHAELLAIETDQFMLPQLWDNLGGIDDSAESIDREIKRVREFLDETPGLIASERELILEAVRRELEAALVDVDRQRVETLAAVSSEREAVFAGIDVLRGELLGDVDRVRVEASTDVEAIVERQAQALLTEADGLIDKAFWRALILLAVGLIGLAIVLRISRPPSTA